jgi:methylenetetrahydrofolate dehydrogenase (NADP+)/methenyltetrahydrofolate cyclohydrolase
MTHLKYASRQIFKKELGIINCKILSGKGAAEELKDFVRSIVQKRKNPPKLAVIMVGEDPASKAYVNGKKRDCKECGIDFDLFHFEENVEQRKIERTIAQLNNDKTVNGILVQLPLPAHLDKDEIIKIIDPRKDVDCFSEQNLGKMFLNLPLFKPCTPSGIMALMEFHEVPLVGKHCVIIGRSDIVGKPLAVMLINAGATVTVCNSHTQNLASITKIADIIICAVGKPKFLTADMIKEGAVVFDVGINRDENGKLCGDVDFENVKLKASAITPVPGGVGLMTRAALMMNILKSAYYLI